MKIIIVGAGQVGSTLAETLGYEDTDITIIDKDAEKLHYLQNHFDIGTVCGFGSHPDVLIQAGAEDADMLIAVTDSDETNIVACQVAYTLFNTPSKIARIRARQYHSHGDLFHAKAMPIDLCISPETLVTENICRLIENPGALQVIDFADGRVRLVAIRPEQNSPLAGKTLAQIYALNPDIVMRVVAIFRHNRSISLSQDTVIENGDEIFFIAAKPHIKSIMANLRQLEHPYKRITIAGGGNIGCRLAEQLEKDYLIKIIEKNPALCRQLADKLNHSTILLGDACDTDLLTQENIEYTDVFCALTNDDEVNVIAAMQAKQLGVRNVIALITRTAYVELIQGGKIDVAISPQQATIGSILTQIRRGDIISVHSLRRGAAEAIELVVHGDQKSSKIVGRHLADLKLPAGVSIGALVRDNKNIAVTPEQILAAGDHVVLFLIDKKRIHDVEKLFQVGFNFF
jgi:trk system potassium uptake protein